MMRRSFSHQFVELELSLNIVKRFPKMIIFRFIFFSLLHCTAEASLSFQFSQIPSAIAYTPNSVLQEPLTSSAYYHDSKRSRASTCTAVCWMNDDKHLIALSLESSSLQVYTFDSTDQSLQFIRHIDNTHGMKLARPSSGAISSELNLLAVANLAGKTDMYLIDSNSTIQTPPILTINTKVAHGVRFSRDSRFLGVASLATGMDIYSLETPPKLIQSLGKPFAPLAPKSIDFSLDERFAAIGFCYTLTNQVSPKEYGMIAIYTFDKETGRLDPEPVCTTDRVESVETLVFHPNGTALFAVDQAHDRIIGLEFDTQTGQIGEIRPVLEGVQTELCFPHGMSFTSDGKFAAVSNHGDDKVTIYQVNSGE